MIGIQWWQKIVKALIASLIIGVIVSGLAGCGSGAGLRAQQPTASQAESGKASSRTENVSEVSPPETIQQLRQALEVYQPQVAILSPQPDQVLQDDKVKVRLQVRDLPTFKNQDLDMGPYLQVILDNQPYTDVYDSNQPLELSDLAPGTHTIRVFASRPWHESFKNEGAYAQTTFHIFTKTQDNNPDPTQPLLTYSRPKGSYGAEPILLDFYLTNAPLHLVAQEDSKDNIADWSIRCTVNGNSFVLDRWEPIYLKGFKPGKNWVQLEFLDEKGPVKNAFNNTVRIITYEPNGQDTLSKLVRGELSVAEARGIVEPNYKPTPAPTPSPTPSLAPIVPAPTPITPSEPAPQPSITPEPQPVTPSEETPSEPAPQPSITPEPQPVTPSEETPSAVKSAPLGESKPEVFHSPVEKQKPGGFFSRYRRPVAKPSPMPPIPELINPPASDVVPEAAPQPEGSAEKPSPSPSSDLNEPVEPTEEQLDDPNLGSETLKPKSDVKELLLP